MPGIRIFETPIRPEWIDYNGHLRDAYYAVIFSEAIDALMDRVGLDAGYRQRTGGTLYTVEMHLHYLHEVKQADTAVVTLRILGTDSKRIHASLELLRAGNPDVAAGAEVMLLHVRQHQGIEHGVECIKHPAQGGSQQSPALGGGRLREREAEALWHWTDC